MERFIKQYSSSPPPPLLAQLAQQPWGCGLSRGRLLEDGSLVPHGPTEFDLGLRFDRHFDINVSCSMILLPQAVNQMKAFLTVSFLLAEVERSSSPDVTATRESCQTSSFHPLDSVSLPFLYHPTLVRPGLSFFRVITNLASRVR